MSKVTMSELSAIAARMSRITSRPTGEVWQKINGENVATVGALMVESGSRTYGRPWALVEIVNTSGGQRALLRGLSAAELRDLMHAYIDGFLAAQAQSEESKLQA